MASADVLMDEVTLLEAALREAVARRSNGSPGIPQSPSSKELHKEVLRDHVKFGVEARNYGSSAASPSTLLFRERFDDAVTSYGVQLKGWIDMQVDARLNLTLRSLLDAEFMALRQESGTALGAVQQAESEMEVLKGTQAKLLAVVEGISEELARTKTAVSAFQLGAQLDTAAKAKREVDVDDCKSELKRWVEESQTRLSEDIIALQQQLLAELRNETTAAFRSEAAAVAALDEQLWLTDQRLGQRIDELAHSQRECVTVIERRKGSSEQRRYDSEELAREESLRMRPPLFADDGNSARGPRFRLGGALSGSVRSAGNALTNLTDPVEAVSDEVQATEAEADVVNGSEEVSEGVGGKGSILATAMERVIARNERRTSEPLSLRMQSEAPERHRFVTSM